MAALATFALLNLELALDLSSFMLGEPNNQLVQLSQQVAKSEISRTLVVLVEAEDGPQAVEATRELERRIRATPDLNARLDSVVGGPPEGIEEAMWALYRPRVLSLVATTSASAQAAVSDEAIGRSLDELLFRLRSPMSTLLARVAPQDPLLILPRRFEAIARSARGGVQVVDGRFLSRDGRHGVLFIRTLAPALDGEAQRPLLEGIRAVFEGLSDRISLKLKMGGVHRFAAEIERSIRRDIARVSVLSTLSLLALFLLLFRSLRVVGATLIVLTSGFVVGLAVTLLVFGRVHGLTLAFGASLIGVSIDYSVHFFVHHAVETTGRPPRVVLQEIWPGLVLGALTTVAGFTALAISSLPGLLEVSVFAAAGILGALGATGVFLPSLVDRRPHHRVARILSGGLGELLRKLQGCPRWVLWLLPMVTAVGAFVGLSRVVWDDDIARLTRIDPVLVEEEEDVRAQISPFEQRRFVVATGSTAEAALLVNDAVYRALAQAVADGELVRYRNLSAILPSRHTQKTVAEAVRETPNLFGRIRAAGVARGFQADAFDPFRDLLIAPMPKPIDFPTLVESPMRTMVEPFRLELPGGDVGLMSFLGGVERSDRLRIRIEAIPGAIWFDQSQLYLEANRSYRERTVRGLLVGWVVVVALVLVRYRRISLSLAALAPATLAVGLTAAVLGLLELPINLVALTALLMVFSMGVDYGVFLAERRSDDGQSATFLAIVVAWASTLAGFGLLAMSSHPAMRTIGVVASIGVTSTMLLVPVTMALARRNEERPC